MYFCFLCTKIAVFGYKFSLDSEWFYIVIKFKVVILNNFILKSARYTFETKIVSVLFFRIVKPKLIDGRREVISLGPIDFILFQS